MFSDAWPPPRMHLLFHSESFQYHQSFPYSFYCKEYPSAIFASLKPFFSRFMFFFGRKCLPFPPLITSDCFSCHLYPSYDRHSYYIRLFFLFPRQAFLSGQLLAPFSLLGRPQLSIQSASLPPAVSPSVRPQLCTFFISYSRKLLLSPP